MDLLSRYLAGEHEAVWRVLTATDLAVHLRWGEPQTADGRDRRTWAADLRAHVAVLAGLPPPAD